MRKHTLVACCRTAFVLMHESGKRSSVVIGKSGVTLSYTTKTDEDTWEYPWIDQAHYLQHDSDWYTVLIADYRLSILHGYIRANSGKYQSGMTDSHVYLYPCGREISLANIREEVRRQYGLITLHTLPWTRVRLGKSAILGYEMLSTLIHFHRHYELIMGHLMEGLENT